MSYVNAKSLTKRFGDNTVFEDIEFSIEKGEFITLLGPSGCGKSTLLSLLAGVTVPTQGSIELLGKAINQFNNSKRDRFRADHIGYIFQNFNLLPYLSPIENVTLGCQFSKQRQKKALENIQAILELSNSSMNHVIRVTIYVTDITAGKIINEIYSSFFSEILPVREMIEVRALPLGAQIEISVIAERKL